MVSIGKKERDFLAKEFGTKLVNEVRLVVFTQEVPCAFCKETVEVVQELSGISPKVKVEVYDFIRDQMRAKELRIDKIPAIAVIGAEDYGVRFYGIPTGYEFSSLVGAIIDVSKGDSGLSQKTRAALKAVDNSVHIQVFVTPTCPYCPAAVRIAHKMAIETEMIWAEMVEATEFVPLAQKHGVTSVPKVVINEKFEFNGAVSEDLFVSHVLQALAQVSPVQPR